MSATTVAGAPSPARTEDEVQAWVGVELDAGPGDIVCEPGFITHWCESVADANPLYWDEDTAAELTGGLTAPPTMLSVWMRPLMFDPRQDDDARIRPLELHFVLKDALELPEGVVSANELAFGVPIRPGDRLRTVQSVRDISPLKRTRVGTGRFWTIDVTYTTQDGEVAGVETYVMFGYRREDA